MCYKCVYTESTHVHKSSPKVKKVQGRHCFQNCKLVHQQSEDHYDPVDPIVHLQHVALITDLNRWNNVDTITIGYESHCDEKLYCTTIS